MKVNRLFYLQKEQTQSAHIRSLCYFFTSSVVADRKKRQGDVCFPGGKFDARFDQNIICTALRETNEELGLVIFRENVLFVSVSAHFL
jgi:8-oxo-dGTP pyrophosphatase MutT (NUDIX family)